MTSTTAAKGTGPVTEAGKAKMRDNALRHGLTSEHVVIKGEDLEEYEALRQELLDDWKPAGKQEEMLVAKIAESAWRLMQVPRVETRTYDNYTLVAEKLNAAGISKCSPDPDDQGHRLLPLQQQAVRQHPPLRDHHRALLLPRHYGAPQAPERKEENRNWLCFAKTGSADPARCELDAAYTQKSPRAHGIWLCFAIQPPRDTNCCDHHLEKAPGLPQNVQPADPWKIE